MTQAVIPNKVSANCKLATRKDVIIVCLQNQSTYKTLCYNAANVE
jgi:hypothetical protein